MYKCCPMDRLPVTHEPVEFEKQSAKIQGFMKITYHFRAIYEIYPMSTKNNRKMATFTNVVQWTDCWSHMNRLSLRNNRLNSRLHENHPSFQKNIGNIYKFNKEYLKDGNMNKCCPMDQLLVTHEPAEFEK